MGVAKLDRQAVDHPGGLILQLARVLAHRPPLKHPHPIYTHYHTGSPSEILVSVNRGAALGPVIGRPVETPGQILRGAQTDGWVN